MRVLFDHQAFLLQKRGGITRYFAYLMREFKISGNPRFSFSGLCTVKNDYLGDLGIVRTFTGINSRSVMRQINKWNTRRLIFSGKFDIFHATYYDPYFSDISNRPPSVITVFDMIHELFPDLGQCDQQTIQNKRTAINQSDGIIAISEQTRSDILRLYPKITPNKISVVYLADPLVDIEPKQITCPEHFILFIGNRTFYKNFSVVLSSLSQIHPKHPDLYLICAGGGPFSGDEQKAIGDSGLTERVILFDGINDNQLKWLYGRAQAFIFPSRYEGFGIPILEAFGSNCPVLLSRTDIFYEVAQDAALYFDPDSPQELSDLIEKLIRDRDIRNKLIQAGNLRNRDFSWKITAQKTMQFYESVLERGAG